MQLISLCWFYISQPNCIYWLVLTGFWLNLKDFLKYTKSSANNGSFISFFQIWLPFISLSWLIALGRTVRAILNKSVESRHPCFDPDLKGKAFSFSLLIIVLALDLLYMVRVIMWHNSGQWDERGTCYRTLEKLWKRGQCYLAFLFPFLFFLHQLWTWCLEIH